MFDPSTLVEYNTVFPDTFDTTGAKLGAQLFTSMVADLRQVINGGFEFSRCLKVTFSWRKGCDNNGVSMLTQKRRFVFFTFLIGVNVPMEQLHQGKVLSKHLLNEETLFMSWRISAIK